MGKTLHKQNEQIQQALKNMNSELADKNKECGQIKARHGALEKELTMLHQRKNSATLVEGRILNGTVERMFHSTKDAASRIHRVDPTVENWTVSELNAQPMEEQKVTGHEDSKRKIRMEEAQEHEPLSPPRQAENNIHETSHKWNEMEELLTNSISKLDEQQGAWKEFISG